MKNSGTTAVAVIMLALGMAANTAFAGAGLQSETSAVAAARWEGPVQIPGNDLVVVIDLAQDSKGNWAGSAIVPGFGIKGSPLADITVKDSDVAFTLKGSLGDPKFYGRITPAGTLAGKFEQGGQTAPFTFQKSGLPQVEPQPQSTPVSKELEGEWQGDFELMGKKLRGLVTLTNQARGSATAQFQIKGDLETQVPIELVTERGGSLSLETPRQGFIYQGQFSKGTNEIKGNIQFGPMETPLVLHRAQKTEAEPKP